MLVIAWGVDIEMRNVEVQKCNPANRVVKEGAPWVEVQKRPNLDSAFQDGALRTSLKWAIAGSVEEAERCTS